MKTYQVNIDAKSSQDVVVIAKNKREAKKKAWIKFSKKVLKPKYFNIEIVDEA